MSTFPLKILTPDGLIYDGAAERLIVRTAGGDVTIFPRHMDYVAPLGMGRAVVVADGRRRTAACIGGMLSVSAGEVTLIPTTFEWAEDIDLSRAERSYHRAKQIIQSTDASETEMRLAEARLHRALVRKSVASRK